MANGPFKPGAIFLFPIPADVAIRWMKAFIGARKGDDAGWAGRILLAFSTMTEAFDLVDAMQTMMMREADALQQEALRSIAKDITKVHSKLRVMDRNVAAVYSGVRSGIPQDAFLSALWAGVAMPLAYGPDSVVQQIASIRNQLSAADIPITGSIISSTGRTASFSDLQEWPAQAFRQGVTWAWTQAQTTPDGESDTIRDVTEAGLAKALELAERGAVKIGEGLKKGAKAAAPWATIVAIVLGVYVLRRR